MIAAHGHSDEILILLFAAVCIVAALGRLRISPVLGYLIAGAAVGSHGFGLVEANQTTESIAQLGVIFLLFTIGLELSIHRLRSLRKQVYAFGLAQMLVTTLIISLIGITLGLSICASIIIGGGLALSSTAIVLQVLEEKHIRAGQVGRLSLATLILQDLMVIPLLVMVQMFALPEEQVALEVARIIAQGFAVILLIILAGRVALRPVFRFIARQDNGELLTAAILLVVLGSAWASQAAGLSPALGAFIAGVLVAETEFRPQVEADILPFKGLLLGFFFMVVGMSLDMGLLIAQWLPIVMLTLALIAGKALIIMLLSRMFLFSRVNSLRLSLMLAQGSEFAFVLFGLALDRQIITSETTQILLVTVTLSMGLTPMLATLGMSLTKVLARRSHAGLRSTMHETHDISHHVVIVGYGRVGSAIGKLMDAERLSWLALDINADCVASARVHGRPVHYGDAARALVLKAVGIERARAAIITHADSKRSKQAIIRIRTLCPEIPIIVRAKHANETHIFENLGATIAVADMLEASLQLGGTLLDRLGVREYEIGRLLEDFRAGDYARLREANR